MKGNKIKVEKGKNYKEIKRKKKEKKEKEFGGAKFVYSLITLGVSRA